MFSSRALPKVFVVFLTVVLGILSSAELRGAVPTLTVRGYDWVNKTDTELTEYRWVLEEDRTYHIDPDEPTSGLPPDPNTLSVRFHASYMPVIDKGDEDQPLPNLDALKHYYISVMPKAPGSYSIGGAQIATGQTSVTVWLNKLPLPTAQITVMVFEDRYPINNVLDQPEETGLPGFNVKLEDAGGRYGVSAGEQSTDAWGNPLGARYLACPKNPNPSQTCDPLNVYLVDAEGVPIPQTDNKGVLVVDPMVTGPDGTLTIKNLQPGKYGVIIIPPQGQGWQQTSTIEGTKVIDAWVKPLEPPYFAEFGPPGWHTEFGFIKQFTDATVLAGGPGAATLRGTVVNNRLSRPPNYDFFNGATFPHTTAWVGLNDNGGLPGSTKGVYASPTVDGAFQIPNVSPGTYQLAIWDNNLDFIFALHVITVNPDGTCSTPNASCDLGDVPVFNWFSGVHAYAFNDLNGDGFWDPNEPALADQVVNTRWRDGTVYQSSTTDSLGFFGFDETFPFLAWQVSEVDYTRGKPTGVTVIVDNGGPVGGGVDQNSAGSPLNRPMHPNVAESLSLMTPQWQCVEPYYYVPSTGMCSDGTAALPYRIENAPSITQAFQGILGQTSILLWGKQPYDGTTNGGISGVVYYDTTRAEDDPRYNGPEVWQPGIPGVEVKLRDKNGVELYSVVTDDWDATPPTGCQGDVPFKFFGTTKDCYDGLRAFNQVRPGIFDGGYAFTECYKDPNSPACLSLSQVEATYGAAGVLDPDNLMPLPRGEYIVEVVPPTTPDGTRRTYEVVKEEDKNVDFGDNYTPSPHQLTFPPCVGNRADLGYDPQVPPSLLLFPGVSAAKAGEATPLCNQKLVALSNGQNAMSDFYLFTEVPIAGHFYGFILDDTANEFDNTAPNFGEKYAPPYLPVAVRDWTGREIGRVYSDKYGVYNGLLPSTNTANAPKPSGMVPFMATTCMNARFNGNTQDPLHNEKYSEFCYNFQYMPGTTTYLDTPVVPVGAFAGPNQNQLDCEYPDKTPKIDRVTVNNPLGGGPLVTATGQTITIQSVGTINVPNPEYCPGPPITGAGVCPTVNHTKEIPRDYGFGTTAGTVTLGGVPLTNVNWTNGEITATIPSTVPNGRHQLVVTRVDLLANAPTPTITGLTVEVQRGLTTAPRRVDVPTCGVAGDRIHCSIQEAIDAASAGDLILVSPSRYDEMVIMYKPVKLQGWGEGSTTINAVKIPTEKLQVWRDKVQALLGTNAYSLLPAQEAGAGTPEPVLLFSEEGAGILVLARSSGNTSFTQARAARIDGLTITGADTGGGIIVNGYADYLQISNNRVSNNSGFWGGGVRVGHPALFDEGTGLLVDADNDNVSITNNHISNNGALGGSGAGVSLCSGSDNYLVAGNFICGNFQAADGGGIGHLGLSNNGRIERNTILFNENFVQTVGVYTSGGGISIAGQAPPLGQTVSQGSGSVKILSNLIQGNLAGSGDGGGIRLARINGADVDSNRNRADRWYQVDILNNMIVNNVAGKAAGGVSLSDALKVNMLHNTIARNDSAAVSGGTFSPGVSDESNPQPAGIVSFAHSPGLGGVLALVSNSTLPTSSPSRLFSNPLLQDNIVWQNRSFFFQVTENLNEPNSYDLLPNSDGLYQDLAVLGTTTPTTPVLSPTWSLLTYPTDGDGNITGDPMFLKPYFNQQGGVTIFQPETGTTLTPPPAFDEGGNFIRLRYGPLSVSFREVLGGPLVTSNYHINTNSAAVGAGGSLNGAFGELAQDIDGDPRPGTNVDIGADQRPVQ